MNDPEIGDIVLWHPDADRAAKPYPAMVTAIGSESINVNIFDPFSFNMQIKDGVRHIDDPKCKNPHTRSSGAWEETPATKRLRQIEEFLALDSQWTPPKSIPETLRKIGEQSQPVAV